MNMPVLGPFTSNGFDFVMEGPDYTSDDLLIMSSQPRRLWPEPRT